MCQRFIQRASWRPIVKFQHPAWFPDKHVKQIQSTTEVLGAKTYPVGAQVAPSTGQILPVRAPSPLRPALAGAEWPRIWCGGLFGRLALEPELMELPYVGGHPW